MLLLLSILPPACDRSTSLPDIVTSRTIPHTLDGHPSRLTVHLSNQHCQHLLSHRTSSTDKPCPTLGRINTDIRFTTKLSYSTTSPSFTSIQPWDPKNHTSFWLALEKTMHQTYCLGTSDLDFRSKLARPFSNIHHLYSLTPYERTFPESYLIGGAYTHPLKLCLYPPWE